MSLRDAAVQALEALTFDGFTPEDATHRYYTTKAITTLRAALAEPEPVKQKQEKQMKKIELDGETADRITVLNLKEYLSGVNKKLEEHYKGAYMHPDDLRHNRMIIPALEMVIHDFGGDDE